MGNNGNSEPVFTQKHVSSLDLDAVGSENIPGLFDGNEYFVSILVNMLNELGTETDDLMVNMNSSSVDTGSISPMKPSDMIVADESDWLLELLSTTVEPIAKPIWEPQQRLSRDSVMHSCLEEAAQTYQTVEENLGWAPVGKIQLLRLQKSAIMRCESLLDCKDCVHRPEFVMLVISMAYRVLVSIDGTARAKLENDNPLDEEDSQRAVKSLMELRLEMQARLITRLEVLVGIRKWPVHETLVKGMRERHTEAMMKLVSG